MRVSGADIAFIAKLPRADARVTRLRLGTLIGAALVCAPGRAFCSVSLAGFVDDARPTPQRRPASPAETADASGNRPWLLGGDVRFARAPELLPPKSAGAPRSSTQFDPLGTARSKIFAVTCLVGMLDARPFCLQPSHILAQFLGRCEHTVMPSRPLLLPLGSLPCSALPGLVGEAGWVMQHCVCDLSNKFVLHLVRVAAAGNRLLLRWLRAPPRPRPAHERDPIFIGKRRQWL